MTQVRPARPADVEALTALERACLGRDAWSGSLVREGVCGGLPTVTWLVAQAGPEGPVVGYAVVSTVGEVAELQRLGVGAEHRRGGVASGLLAAVVAAAGRSGAERLLLEVREDNAGARAFYARHGLVEIARRRRYYADGATAVVLQVEVAHG